ncbi:MAG: protein translocase subunit SecDF [Candidatus Pseudobacter hemicellulosilyticus]|uniref:Multifunctional fusion protein n=1 Tax=Candidatus Pseudobacter hemicellulosilyticus TaxID=3121375 RepID=A0AAJ6BF05_9BACT|nr:MAG: protein translocase subunit SecDF [Pseudobacter sp.]
MRALVSIFTALLIGISLYQLSFTWFVNKHEKEMADKAVTQVKRASPQSAAQKYPDSKEAQALYQDTLDNLLKDRKQALLDSTADKKITWWGQTYRKAKESELLLGLDLQGGINVTLDIALDGLIKGLANNPKDPQIVKAIEEANRLKLTSDQNYISLFATAFSKVNPGTKMAPHFANGNNKLSASASDNQVISYMNTQANNAMGQTFEVLRKRIDKFGVAQPTISLDESKGIITVELAGASDPERVRKYLQSTANLQFWEMYTWNDLGSGLQKADQALAQLLSNPNRTGDSTVAALADSVKKDTSLAATNPLFIKLNPPQPYADAQGRPAYGAALGYSRLQDTAVVNAYLAMPSVRAFFPGNAKFLWGKQERDSEGKPLQSLALYSVKTIPGKEGAELEGNAIEDANQEFNQMTNEVTVTMSMTPSGSTTWARMTGRNIGKPIAIVLDDIVYTAPNVNQKIEGGNSSITMGRGEKNRNLVIEEAQDIAKILKSGKLEAPAKIVQEQIVGPTLGQAAIKGGMMAFGLSFIVIFILMLVYYNTGGWVANIALILNLLFTVGVLSALGATLTAPGIAGLVLTIGIAVDTNVLIFERIKEELTKGKSYSQAVIDGYKRSMAPVLDAHFTNLLTAIILFYFGLGPVLGFATTQILGILLSLFCGIFVSRLVSDFWTKKNRHFNYFTPLSRKIFKHASFRFIEYRKKTYIISIVILLLGIAALFNGFKYGVEFSGGRSYVVRFDKPVNAEQVREALEKTFDKSPVVKTYGSPSQLDITTDYLIEQSGMAVDSTVQNKLYEGLKPFLEPGISKAAFDARYLQGAKKVDATISDDLKAGAQWATFWSLFMIAVYILIRFRDWRYSIGTIVGLLHDVLITVIVFSFLKDIMPFSLEVDQHFIAAILTVIGFSMNDKVIVFDRIREYSREMIGADKTTIINRAINDTLSRTIMTSFTVFLTILILFLVGGEVTKGFAFAMLVGVVTATYSSIFVSAPILVDFAKDKPLGEQHANTKPNTPSAKPKPASPLADKKA